MKILAVIFLTLIISLPIIFFIISYIFFKVVFHFPKKYHDVTFDLPKGPGYQKYGDEKMLALIQKFVDRPYEKVEIKSREGFKLTGKYYHVKDGAPIALCCHGYKGTGIRDFCGGGDIVLSLGQNVLLIDQRNHGTSEGKWITFGIKERYDVGEWINYINDRFGRETTIYLYGVSMGAATALLASLNKDLPSNVKKVLVDCPYSSCKDITIAVGESYGIPSWITKAILYPSCRLYGHFSYNDGDILKEIKNAKIPTLIIHGKADTLVPHEMSIKIAEQNKKMVQLELFDNADHAMSFMEDNARYKKLIKDFLNK
ncbi:MAG: alpha/beta hydrolase [Bacilli bacterium]|nr:alpha/beta hydrolase [Bacilli bacterium]